MTTARVVQGDCLDVLRALPAGSAQTCVTSPPYYLLRDYGVDGQIGQEESPEAFIGRLVEVFREVRRVLADDGTLWVNIGDSYATTSKTGEYAPNGSTIKQGVKLEQMRATGRPSKGGGLANKNLIGIPWMLAFALRADGWILRQDIIWHKPNPMPESVTDRCTKAHEYVFLLSKGPRYYFDAQAIAEPSSGKQPGNASHKHADAYAEGDEAHRTKSGLVGYAERQRSKRDSFKRENSKRAAVMPGQSVGTHRPDREESAYSLETRNKRSVWTISTRPFKEAHFATMPLDLARTCIRAGSRPGDTVLDPFMGAFTTAYAALELGRNALGAELNAEYIAIGEQRIAPLLRQPVLLGVS